MKKILVVDKMHDSLGDMLSEIGYQMDYQPAIDRSGILSIIHDYNGLIIRSKTQVNKELLDAAVNLEFIGRAGAGVDLIDVDYVEARGVKLFNAPEGNRDALGEHGIGMLLTILHKIHAADLEIRDRKWRREPNRGTELKGKTIGIFGYGFMGSAMAEKLAGFGCRVIAYDKYKSDFGNEYVEEVDWETFCKQTQILSLHVPLTDETRNLANATWLHQFPNLMLILNTSRGEVLVLKDVLALLKSGQLIGAALDVLENEKIDQLTPEQMMTFKELTEMPNVLFTPHVAGWTFESYRRINEVLVKKISQGM